MPHFDAQASPTNRLSPHGAPALLLLAFALLTAVWAWTIGYEYRWTSDTTDTFYQVISTLPGTSVGHRDGILPTLLGGLFDVIAQKPVSEWYQALFEAYLRSFHLVYGDISLAYKVQVFPLSVLFSFSAYGFFYWLTRNRWLALALALAALLPMPLSWAGERSGLGPIWTYTRRYFLTAWLPLLVFFYFRAMLDRRKLIIPVIASVGLASNLHASGIILLEILVLTWLVVDRITVRRLIQACLLMAVGLLFSIASLASLWKAGLGAISQLMLALLSNDAVAAPLLLLDKARLAMPEVQYLFYPPKIYARLSPGLVDAWLIATVIVSLWPLVLRARQKLVGPFHLFAAASACLLFISFEQMWAWVLLSAALYVAGRPTERPRAYILSAYLIICNFWVAVVGMLLFQLGYGLIDGFPLVFNQLRGIRFLGFLVFVWLAVLAAPVAARRRPWTRHTRLLILALGVSLIVAGSNFQRNYFRGLDSDNHDRKVALLDLALWAREHTPSNSVFLVGYSSFGIRAERRITHSDKVVRNAGIDWLPPKGLKNPGEALALAQQYGATHLFIAPVDVSPALGRCVNASNSAYALLETGCVQTALSAAASGTLGESEQSPP